MHNQLSSVIERLVGCLRALNGTGGSSALPAENNEKKQKTIQKEIRRVKKTVLNLSKKTLSNAEYRLLGKGLKTVLSRKVLTKFCYNKTFLSYKETKTTGVFCS